MLLRAIIIDDEPKNVRLLKAILSDSVTGLQIVGDATDVDEGVLLTKSLKPDIVFLDIRMSEHDEGFRFFTHFTQPTHFEVIFVTAYEEFIRRAFNSTPAIGYLMKPIDPEELTQVIFKVKQKLLATKFKNGKNNKTETYHEVIYCFIQDGIIKLKLVDNKEKVSTKTKLEEFENITHFFRINRQVVVNMNFIKKIIDIDEKGEKMRGAVALLYNNEKIIVSFNRKPQFIRAFEALSQQSL